jgi:ribosome-binding factor A
MNPRVSDIKRAQKESLFLREFSSLFMRVALDVPLLQELSINRVQLSATKSVLTIFFYCAAGETRFKELRPSLVLYKPSLRKGMAQAVPSRYSPDIVFKYDSQFEKQLKLEMAIEAIKSGE